MIFTYHNTDIRKGDRVRTLHELAAQATKEYEKENTEESEEVNTNDFGLITLEDGRKLLVRPDKMASFNKEEYTCVNLVDGRNAYLDRNGEVVAIEEEMEIEEEEERE